MFELNNNIINCFVAIFDKNPEKYLNINRNVLKYDGIKYSDIVACEKRIFTEFCKMMVNNSISGCNSIDFFPILSVLFARFADEKVLNLFENKYKNELENITINSALNQDGLKLSVFFGREKSFCVYSEINDKDAKKYDFIQDSEECKDNAINIEKLYEHFPKSFFVPTNIKIQKYEQQSRVIYCCKIRHESCREYTDVDEKCWKLDCLELGKDWNQLVKKALKPISKYKNICVNKLPKTFQKSCVFKNILDNNISEYIISPFSDKSAKNMFECKKCNPIDLKLHINQIKEIMNVDEHFNKCVKYVLANHEGDMTEEMIQDEYFKLASEMAKIFNTYYREV